MLRPTEPKTLMRNLGEAFGHLWKAATTNVTTDIERTTIKREVEETHHDSPEGRVTVRRTTIEEIEIEPTPSDPSSENQSAT